MKTISCALVFSIGLVTGQGEPDSFRLIRNNDLSALAKRSASVLAADAQGNTPLHYAALYGSPESVALLLKAGASPNARNGEGVTPLIYGATSLAKTKLMLERGGEVKAASDKGRTPLHVAVGSTDGFEIARLLIEKGADVNAVDARGDTPLNLVNGNTELMRLLLAKGASAKVASITGITPLMNAASMGKSDQLGMLLKSGSDINAATKLEGQNGVGKLAIERRFALLFAAQGRDPNLVKLLLAAGADPKLRDIRGMTALMFAVHGDRQNLDAVKALLEAGADPNARDTNGESVLDWARKTPHPEVLRLLEAAGAQTNIAPPTAPKAASAALAPLREALQKAARLVASSNPVFFKKGGCMACHHQPAALVVSGAMRDAGLPFDRAAADIQAKAVLTARSADVLQGIEFGGRHDSALYALDGSMAYASPANSTTDMLVHYLSYTQNANGSWSSRGPVSSRPPAQDSDIQRTAHNAKLLLHYGWPARQAEFQRAAAKARQWLEQAEPVAQYEVSELLIGLVNVGSPKADAVARRLVSIQHSGGGWAQSQYLAPDAYATSLAMHALRLHGMKVSDPVYARGVKFLRESQLEDGSWYVASRSAKFQPYFQSGFPHEHDQWISILATAYAVRALAPVHAEE